MSLITDTILGFVVGDAMGVPVEFESREYLKENKIEKMEGYMSYMQPAGTWSDDSSMTLATIDSIIERKTIDYEDMMNKFVNWYQDAAYTATDMMFDIGNTTREALKLYLDGFEPLNCGFGGIYDNGNGSLMRMLPIALYTYYKNIKDEMLYEIVKDTSSLTHSHPISIMGCYIYVKFIHFLIETKDKNNSYNNIKNINYQKYFDKETILKYDKLFDDIYKRNIDEICSSGYIVSTLEAVFYVILNNNTYKDAILEAINLGEDTDTIGAITGSIISIISNDIPENWLRELKKRQLVDEISKEFEKCLVK